MTQLQNPSPSAASSVAVAEPEKCNEIPNNQAIERCIKAWHRTFDLASIDPENDSLTPSDDDDSLFAREQASLSFRDAMPPLVGYENIGDFIACTTYAMLMNIFDNDECQRLLGAAKIAMALLRARPRS
ncbi:MAG: hypothetical protein ACLQG3_13270 [Terracidiphilus sp.]